MEKLRAFLLRADTATRAELTQLCDQARDQVANLESLIDGDERDPLGSLLAPIRDFLRELEEVMRP